jgi:hypothetical protein
MSDANKIMQFSVETGNLSVLRHLVLNEVHRLHLCVLIVCVVQKGTIEMIKFVFEEGNIDPASVSNIAVRAALAIKDHDLERKLAVLDYLLGFKQVELLPKMLPFYVEHGNLAMVQRLLDSNIGSAEAAFRAAIFHKQVLMVEILLKEPVRPRYCWLSWALSVEGNGAVYELLYNDDRIVPTDDLIWDFVRDEKGNDVIGRLLEHPRMHIEGRGLREALTCSFRSENMELSKMLLNRTPDNLLDKNVPINFDSSYSKTYQILLNNVDLMTHLLNLIPDRQLNENMLYDAVTQNSPVLQVLIDDGRFHQHCYLEALTKAFKVHNWSAVDCLLKEKKTTDQIIGSEEYAILLNFISKPPNL